MNMKYWFSFFTQICKTKLVMFYLQKFLGNQGRRSLFGLKPHLAYAQPRPEGVLTSITEQFYSIGVEN